MKFKFFLLAAMSSLFVVKGAGQTVTVDGEVKSRGEIRNGFQNPLDKNLDTGFGGFLRTKLSASYSDEILSAKIGLINSNVYGQTPVNGAPAVGIAESWIAYNFTPEFSGTLGRMALSYDDGRLFSGNDFAASPSSHDLLLLKYKSSQGFQAHVGAAFSHNNDGNYFKDETYTSTSGYKSMYLLWLGQKVEKVNISGIFVNDNYHLQDTQPGYDANDPTLESRFTVGLNFDMNEADTPISFHAGGYLQFGDDPNGKDLSTYYVNGKISYKFVPKFTVTAGADIFSGTAYDETKKNKTFNKLYGANHYSYGYMEYWTKIPNRGLAQWYIGVSGDITEKLNLSLNFNKLSTMKDFSATDDTRNLGSELDFMARYNYSKNFLLEGGVSTYFKTDGTMLYKGMPVGLDVHTPLWAYLMITFRPTFFSTKVN
ncbi:MAG: alginate export family protein [Flavobacteriaceae bacterium]|jgi:hypothetical protein|nr:alginate export family protein [Flavobacteriaceae bacterium]